MITRYRGEFESGHMNGAMDWGEESLFKYIPELAEETECWIAGGGPLHYFLGQYPNDIDVWFSSKEAYANVFAHLTLSNSFFTDKNYGGHTILKSPTGQKYDLIYDEYFSNADEIIEKFDMTAACCAIGRDQITYHDNYFEHLQTRNLVFNNLGWPTGAFRRLPKYLAKGFTITDDEMERLAIALSEIDMDNIEQNVFEQIRKRDEGEPYKSPGSNVIPFATISHPGIPQGQVFVANPIPPKGIVKKAAKKVAKKTEGWRVGY